MEAEGHLIIEVLAAWLVCIHDILQSRLERTA